MFDLIMWAQEQERLARLWAKRADRLNQPTSSSFASGKAQAFYEMQVKLRQVAEQGATR